MAGLKDIFTIMQKMRSSAEDLSKDIDPAHSREETGQDLNNLSSTFKELQKIFSKIKQSDMEKIQSEVKELLSGQQNFLQYARDVNAILMQVRNRTENNAEIRQKLKQNMPREHKQEDPENFIDKLSGVIDEIKSWGEKTASR